MKILIATDSFKDALPALEVCKAIEKGIQLSGKKVETILFPLGDGGEGTAEILTWHSKGRLVKANFSDPLLRRIEAQYGVSADGQTAFIEMAQTAGLQLLGEQERNCMNTTTFGTGEMIRHAIENGAKKIVLGIGGSATNDAGMGMAAALGYQFFDENDRELEPIGSNLSKVQRIEKMEVIKTLKDVEFRVLCDVENPLYGENGAAFVYARQKGANAEEVKILDEGLRHFASILRMELIAEVDDVKGAGAAGGLGAGAIAFLNAKLVRGIDFVLDVTGFEKVLKAVDLIISGEGKIDHQSLEGKLIQGVANLAQQHNVPVIAFCGNLEAEPEIIKKIGLTAAFSISQKPVTLEESIEHTAEGLENLAFNVSQTVLEFHRNKKP
jgi:glycerate kinase